MYDFLIIGAGLIGAAAARYLAQVSANTAVLGPAEPADVAQHEGVFGSHYDQGRITRQLDRDADWATLAQRSVARYRAIEQASGIRFYEPTGGLYVAAPGLDNRYLDGMTTTAVRLNADYDPLTGPEITQRFPFLRFPAGCTGLWEPPPAGYINPRELVKAQLTIAQSHGAALIRETAVKLIEASDGVTVHTLAGNGYRARRVLLATGAFSNAYPLLPRPPALRIKTETVIMARLSSDEAARLQGMPTVIYPIDHSTISDIYMLPPIRYPDGHVYVKMGCNSDRDRNVSGLAAMRDWYIRGNSDALLPTLQAVLAEILPGLAAEAFTTHRCLIAYTVHGKPYIDAVTSRIFTAIGGNGVSAKSSVALGDVAGRLVENGRWADTLNAAQFQIHFAS